MLIDGDEVYLKDEYGTTWYTSVVEVTISQMCRYQKDAVAPFLKIWDTFGPPFDDLIQSKGNTFGITLIKYPSAKEITLISYSYVRCSCWSCSSSFIFYHIVQT